MQRFKPGDAVYILPKFAHLYPAVSATVTGVHVDPFRSIFNEYTLEFPDGSSAKLFEFQLIEDLYIYTTVIASVAFDSRKQMATTHARGRTSGEQIVLQTPQFDIDMKIRIGMSRASLMGQILERGTTNLLKRLPVRLLKEGTPIGTTTTDDAGAFTFTDVSRGSLNILVAIPQRSVRILGSFSV
jgi:hypothetical protein